MAEVFGVEVQELPEGLMPLEVVAFVKCLDEEGDPTFMMRSSNGITSWEALGIVTAGARVLEAELVDGFLED